ncbi:MAG TPA: penicillin-binding transpeptidase domain-containing protein [Bacteroidota bacterium]
MTMMNGGKKPEALQPGMPPVQAAQKEFSGRFILLKLTFALAFVIVALRLVQVQIVEAGKFQAIARKQYEQRFTLPAVRGNIYDRYGNVLASNTMFVSFAADPKMIGNKADAVAEKFARVFGKPKAHYLSKLREANGRASKKRFVWLERHVKPSVAKNLESTRLEGIVVINEPKRLYHYDELAGQLVGFTDIDNNGISGLEMQFENEMRGTEGSVVMQRDGLGRARPSADYPQIDPVNGNHIILTIDLAFQSIVEEELKRGLALNNADAGLAVMLNPKTGEILALANVPGINPNQYTTYDLAHSKNRVVTNMFEPGSVFKIVTASAAYEYDLVPPDRAYNAEHGKWKVNLPGGKYRFINDTHEHDVLTFQEAIEVSSNIVMAKVSPLIGPERFYRQARDFGFGIPTGVDMPGEVRGRLKKPQEWSGTSLQSMSYGYEVAATPLQIVAAYAAVANKGILMKPYILSQVKDQDGDFVRERKPQVIRHVVSEQTANMLTAAFEGAVERGSAKDVRIEGMRIAGKTGTSRKYIDGKYSIESYTSSFAGYFPADDPQIVCLVMMDNPRSKGYYGGITSGPIFKAIAERIINTTSRFGKTPEKQSSESKLAGITIPDVRNLKVGIASKILEGHGLTVESFGEGDVVVRQSPEPGKRVEHGEAVKLALTGEPGANKNGMMTVPDVRGMSIRRAMNRLVVDEFEVRVEGSGVVTQQSPAPGQKVPIGTAVRVLCEPRAIVSTALY